MASSMIHAAIALLFLAAVSCVSAAVPEGFGGYIASGKYKRGPVTRGSSYGIPGLRRAALVTYLEWNKKGTPRRPVALGVKVTRTFIQNAGKLGPLVKTNPNFPSFPIFLNFPKGTAFEFIDFNWNPKGHNPPVFLSPHFDIHFHLNTQRYVKNNIGPRKGEKKLCPADDYPKTTSPRAFFAAYKPMWAQCFPSDPYGAIPTFYNQMGNHLVDLSAPYLAPNTTAKWPGYLWAYGAFDGKLAFFEPMLSQAWMRTKPTFCNNIPGLPFEYHKAGWYPTVWCVISDKVGTLYIELRNFVWHDAGCKNGIYKRGYLLAKPSDFPKPCKFETP